MEQEGLLGCTRVSVGALACVLLWLRACQSQVPQGILQLAVGTPLLGPPGLVVVPVGGGAVPIMDKAHTTTFWVLGTEGSPGFLWASWSRPERQTLCEEPGSKHVRPRRS